jgi:hypothetical protein
MSLTELANWRQANPKELLHQCANISGTIHLVGVCGMRKFGTSCGLEGSTPQQVLAFLLPAHMVTCPKCAKTLGGGK